MANVLTVDNNGVIITPDEKRVRSKVVLSGNYVQAQRGTNNGEMLDLTAVLNPGYLPGVRWGNKGPTRGYVLNPPPGYIAKIIPGADAYHWLLQLFTAQDTELGAGAYSAPIKADQDIYIEFSGREFD